MEASLRITQRAPRSCQPCYRRKLRCSRVFPCTNCVRRNIPDQCSRERVILSKTTYDFSSPIEDAGLPGGNIGDANNSAALPSPQSAEFETGSINSPAGSMTGSQAFETPTRASRPSPVAIAAAPAVVQDAPEVQLAIDAANTLESLAWGSHHAATRISINPGPDRVTDLFLTEEQATKIMAFHKDSVAWTHNVLHMPTFMEKCAGYRKRAELPDAAWLSLYYSVLSLTFLYASQQQVAEWGLPESSSLSQSFYELALQTLNASDFAANHSIYALQSVCVILPCAHAFGDSKRIVSLHAMAVSVAQLMQLHRLPIPNSHSSAAQIIEHETFRRIWCFLCTQDSYLTTFRRAYVVNPMHATTPLPTNCYEDDDRMLKDGQIVSLPLSQPTQNSFMILQSELARISRDLFDGTCTPGTENLSIAQEFREVLAADNKMKELAANLPPWVREDNVMPRPRWISNLCRSFRIAFAHKRLTLHRRFFCRAVADRKYFFSHIASLESARSILRTYLEKADNQDIEIWTTPAHVISASIIITLNLLFFKDDDTFMPTGCESSGRDRMLMMNCLEQLRTASRPNHIARRGSAMISRLLDQECFQRVYTNLDSEETSRLLVEVEYMIRHEAELLDIDSDILDHTFLSFLEV